MGKYGKAAVRAINLIHKQEISSPKDAWERATSELFPDSRSCQKKGCPKGAFLGLCEEGMIVGVPSGHYTDSYENKSYAVKAVKLLLSDASLVHNASRLWLKVLEGEKKEQNSQMDVVLNLWNQDLIAE